MSQSAPTLSMDAPDKKPNKRQKRRQKSPETLAIQAFLKQATHPFKRQIYGAWGLDMLAVGLLIAQMWVLSVFFGVLLTAQFEGVLTAALAEGALRTALPILAGCLLIRPVLGFLRDKWLSDAGLALAHRERAAALASLEHMGLARTQLGADGAIASYVLDEPEALMGYLRYQVQKYTAATAPLLLAIAIGFVNITAMLVLLLTAPFVPVFMALIGIATARKSREQMDAMAQLSGRFLDWIRGMNSLVRLSALGTAEQDLQRSADDYKKRTMSVLKIAFLNSAVLEWFSALSIALVAVYLGFGLMGILPWAKGEVITSYQGALFVLLLVPEFYAPLRRLGAEYHAKGAAESAAKMLIQFQGQDTSSSVVTSTLPELGDSFTPYLSLTQVSVSSEDRQRLVPLSMQIKAGEKIAIIGHSGAGKTTLLSVLLGFTAYEGVICYAGVPFDTINKDAWRQQVGYLAQTATLLPMSIGDNLRLARPSAQEAELMAVLSQVGLGELMAHLPRGLDTPLSEQGGGLSGGQAQRIAIAQLLLQDAPLWLVDEPSEHLDAETRAQIHTLLAQVSAAKTVLWVTHDSDWQASDYFDRCIEMSVASTLEMEVAHD